MPKQTPETQVPDALIDTAAVFGLEAARALPESVEGDVVNDVTYAEGSISVFRTADDRVMKIVARGDALVAAHVVADAE